MRLITPNGEELKNVLHHRCRTRTEGVFGWIKSSGGQAKIKLRGRVLDVLNPFFR